MIEIAAFLIKNNLPVYSQSVSDIPAAFSFRPISKDERDMGQVDLKEVKAIIRRLRTDNHRLEMGMAQNSVNDSSNDSEPDPESWPG